MRKVKKAVITGANSGIGFEIAKALATRGYRIVMICRNKEKAENARNKIGKMTGNGAGEVVISDLSKQDDIKKAAVSILDNHQSLDLLINNAGILAGEREETVDGYEKTLAINHLAPFLLTNLLKDLLIAAGGARVVNVSSEAHRAGSFEPDNLQLSKGYNSLKAYANSKLYNIMFTRELADRLHDTGITTYSLHPGTVRTNIHSGGGGDSLFSFLLRLGMPFMPGPKKGAKTPVYLATEPGIEPLSGKYFIGKKVMQPLEAASDREKCRLLWDLSETLTIRWS